MGLFGPNIKYNRTYYQNFQFINAFYTHLSILLAHSSPDVGDQQRDLPYPLD